MTRLILIKLGGSSITDIGKESVARVDVIRRLAQEMKGASDDTRLIVGHGSGSFGHIPGHKYRVKEGLINEDSRKGASLTQYVASQLHSIVIGELNEAGLNPRSFPPSSSVVTSDRRIIDWNIDPVRSVLDSGFTPVVYGDVTIDLKLGVTIIPTEEPLRYLAEKLRPAKVILGGDTDGIFTSNPKLDPGAKLIERIDSSNIEEALKAAGDSTKIDVTGGMRSKLEYAYGMAKLGSTCQIINVLVPGRLRSAILGEETVGTVISAD
jgi:isopentenyl phosphate kinase